ncbi:MAG: thioredoxin family protein [Candidatus Sumerlaeaceae bacterium]
MNTTIRMRSIPFEAPQETRFEDVVTVKRIVTVATVLMAFSLFALGVSTAQGAPIPGWGSNLQSGISQAQASGKPLIVVIARDGCNACEAMEANLLQPAAGKALSGAVRVRVDADSNPALTTKFAAGGTPTTIVFSPESGFSSPVYTYTGTMDMGTIRQLGQSINALAAQTKDLASGKREVASSR